MSSESRKPFWLIPNLLSLDAPLVAISWLYVFVQTWRVEYTPDISYVALGLMVWIIYAVDRLLDAAMKNDPKSSLKARHEFHRKHRWKFGIMIFIASATVLWIALTELPMKVFAESIIGWLLVIAFFALSIFTTREPDELPYAKNIIAGFSFAYGTALLAFIQTGFDVKQLWFSAEFICFATLCALNIFAIDVWEHSQRSADVEAKSGNELILTILLLALGAATLFFAIKDEAQTTRPFFYAILTGAALMQIINRNRSRFSMNALRVLADVAMLVPVLVFIASAKSPE